MRSLPFAPWPVQAVLCLLAGLTLGLGACSSKSADPATPPSLAAIGNQNVTAGQLLSFAVTATGSGSGWPTLSTSTLPTGAAFTDRLDGSGTFDWTPSAGQVGNHPVVFRATEGGLADSEIVLIQVTSVPPAPPKDSIFITSDTVFAGDTAEVMLVLSNPDSAVAGLNIWLESVPGILFDTAQALWPRFANATMLSTTQRHDSVAVMALLMVDFTLPLDYVAPGTGPLFKLRFAVSPSQAPGTYLIDTTSMFMPRGVDISYRSGQGVPTVGFVPGQIVVQQ